MNEFETMVSAVALPHKKLSPGADASLTICAISVVAGILTNVLHEGVGHGLTALLTGAKSGVLTTVAWSSRSIPVWSKRAERWRTFRLR